MSLCRLIDNAKKDQVLSHIIEKAEGGSGEDFVPARYEDFGSGGYNVIVDCLTDNGSRTFNELFQKFMDMLDDNNDVQNVYHNVEM